MIRSYSKINYIIVFSFCFFIGCRSEETPQTPKTSSSRKLENNEVISTSSPAGIFQVSKDLPFLADTSFTLEKKSDAHVFFFSDYNEDQIYRFIQIQFESFKPGIEETYNYQLKDSVKIGDAMFGKSYWCFNLEQAAAERPLSDLAAVQSMLKNKDVNTKGIFAGVRLLWLSEDKRSEMLIIYGEKNTYRNIDCGNQETVKPLLEELYKQFLKDFNVKDYK